jgi:recombination DNA repair RAD52 pathway protein
MNRDILEAPFAPEQIKQRQGNFGQTLDYIEAHAVIQRLNDAFDSAWSFEIIEHQILKEQNEVLVLGRLTAGGISKCQFGSSAITRAKQSGEIISILPMILNRRPPIRLKSAQPCSA